MSRKMFELRRVGYGTVLSEAIPDDWVQCRYTAHGHEFWPPFVAWCHRDEAKRREELHQKMVELLVC